MWSNMLAERFSVGPIRSVFAFTLLLLGVFIVPRNVQLLRNYRTGVERQP